MTDYYAYQQKKPTYVGWIPIIAAVAIAILMIVAGILIAIHFIRPVAEAEARDGGGGNEAVQGPAPDSGREGDAGADEAARAEPETREGWVRIPAGTFTMGSPSSEAGREDDEVQHQVTLTRDFLLMEAEVTQDQFGDYMGYNPSRFEKCGPTCPVEQVSWHEAAAYCNTMSEAEEKAPCYRCKGRKSPVTCRPNPDHPNPYECPGYRLPTEAEWEYAARAADKRSTYNGDLTKRQLKCRSPNEVLDPIAWFCGNSAVEYGGAINGRPWGGPRHSGTQRVKQKQANKLGLYDMLGNVWEWCHDGHDSYPTDDAEDPFEPPAKGERVLRGGAFGEDARLNRAGLRNWDKANRQYYQYGFRVAISVQSSE